MNINSLAPETQLHHRYIIEKVIGYGGKGIVFSAVDIIRNMVVAIKELFPSSCCVRDLNHKDIYQYSHNDNLQYRLFRDDFIREAKFMHDLSKCPNLPAFYDIFEENNTWYYVLEFLKGLTLKQYLKSRGVPLLEDEVFNIATNVLSALSCMHRHKIIHRDICSDNIFLTESDKVLLIDLSSAMSFDENGTLLVMVRGGYAPPEQYQANGRLGPWTDIYALGAVMYEALTGIRVSKSIERQAKLIPPKYFNKYITDNMNSAIIKALSIEIEKRFQTAEEFQHYLEFGNITGSKIRMIFCSLGGLVILVFCCIMLLFLKPGLR